MKTINYDKAMRGVDRRLRASGDIFAACHLPFHPPAEDAIKRLTDALHRRDDDAVVAILCTHEVTRAILGGQMKPRFCEYLREAAGIS